MASKLLLKAGGCPFCLACGQETDSVDLEFHVSGLKQDRYSVYCMICDAIGPPDRDRECAVSMWQAVYEATLEAKSPTTGEE